MCRLAEQTHPGFLVTIYYAFKQSETKGDTGTSSTGWETFLNAVIRSGFVISGTWPLRSEQQYRITGMGTNALASSIVLVCRVRPRDAPTGTRREFVAALKSELPVALTHLQRGNIAPVDLAQAAIGPGMAVYTRYAKVLDAEGNALSVREALVLINQTLDETLAQQEGDFDADSRWALAWFEQSGFAEGDYGIAETLSKAKNTSVDGMVEAGILASKGGTVRLLKPEELPPDWDPTTDPEADRLGDGASSCTSAGGRRRKRRGRPRCPTRRQGRGGSRVVLPPVHAMRAQENARRRHSPTTAWCRAGPRLLAWREKSRKPKLNRLRSSQARTPK